MHVPEDKGTDCVSWRQRAQSPSPEQGQEISAVLPDGMGSVGLCRSAGLEQIKAKQIISTYFQITYGLQKTARAVRVQYSTAAFFMMASGS